MIQPSHPLMLKTGTGGLDQNVINRAEKSIEPIIRLIDEDAQQHIANLKNHIANPSIVTTKNRELLDDLMLDLMPLKVNSQMGENRSLSILSAKLLKFLEKINRVNVDSYKIIKSFTEAIELVASREIKDSNHAFTIAVVNELDEACNRYYKKHDAV